jgi:hypothetical protein
MAAAAISSGVGMSYGPFGFSPEFTDFTPVV